MKHDYSNIIAQGMKEIIDSKEHRSLFLKNIKTASTVCRNCNEDRDNCMCGNGAMYADTSGARCHNCNQDEDACLCSICNSCQGEGCDNCGGTGNVDEILTEASIASAVESLVKASATIELLGFKKGATEALNIASIVVEAKKKKDNKKKMKMKMMREKMMKDKKDSSSKNSKSDSSKSNSSSSIPEFLKKKIKFAQYGGAVNQSRPDGTYSDNHPDEAPPPQFVANPGPIPFISNAQGQTSYPQYVSQLDSGLKFLINKLGPTSNPKISGQDRQNYLNQLNTIIKEINRVDAILSKQNSTESRQLQDKLLTMNQSLRDDKLYGNDIEKLTALNSNAKNFSQPSTTVPQQPSAEQVKGVQDYADNLTEYLGAPVVTRPDTT